MLFYWLPTLKLKMDCESGKKYIFFLRMYVFKMGIKSPAIDFN